MPTAFHRLLITKAQAALLALVLCCSVLGIQSLGQFHGVIHVNQDKHFQSSSVFDNVELVSGSTPETSNPVCKLLDSLLLASCVASVPLDAHLLRFNHVSPTAIISFDQTIFQIWPYQSQAPPQTPLHY